MKAPKISLDSAKLQQMLLLHVEKIVLGIVVLAVLWFVYQGATLEGLDPSKTPDKLASDSSNVTTQINNPAHKDALIVTRNPNHQVQSLVKQGQEPNDSTAYRLPNPWKPPDYPKASLRIDPRLFPPEKVVVKALYGPIAMFPKQGDVDPILSIEVAPPATEGTGTGPRQPAVRPGPRRPLGEAGPGGPGPGGPTRPGQRQRRPGGALLEGGGAEAFGEGFQPGGMAPGFGQEGGPGGLGSRTLPPEAMVGFRAGTEVIAKEGKAVVVMAAVPLEKQLEEFEKAFKEALDYDPMRDLPRYVLFRIERADVTADPAIDPAQATWTSLSIAKAMNEMNFWAASPNEVVDIAALDPILTHRAPPFLQRDIYDALVHPDIPKAKFLTQEGAGGLEGDQPGQVPAGAPQTEEGLLNPGVAPPGGRTAQGGQMVEGGPRMGVRPGGYGPSPYAMQGGPRMGPQAGGYGEGGMLGAGSPQEMVIAKYKLIRFTDTTVEPNKKYRYRVKLVMEDPNNPYVGDVPPPWDGARTTPLRKPSIQSMSPNVLTRVRTAEAAPAAPGKLPAYVLESEPSEPSDIVELPPPNHYFAGKAAPGGGSGFPANDKRPATPVILTSPPTANVLTVQWDKDKAADIAGEKEVQRGSTLNYEKEVDVIHPALLIIHPIGKYPFKTNSMVLDFTGGAEMPTVDPKRSDQKVPEPCELLVLDGDGNLHLLDEATSVEGYRRYLPPKAEAAPMPNPAGGGFGPEAGPGAGGLLDGPRQPGRPSRNRGP